MEMKNGATTTIDPHTTCPYNGEVICSTHDWRGRIVDRNFEACGWNPEVAKTRLEKCIHDLQKGKMQANS